MLPRVRASRYVVPLREGGSLPAVLDTDDGLYVAKFRGAGQGAAALVAEVIVGELARRLELPVPELALVLVDEQFGRGERDPEIQELLRRSHGTNVGLRYLEGAFAYDPAADAIDPRLAAEIVWLDALASNVDRTARNSNLLWWRERVWLIDHGSSLIFHHDWPALTRERVRAPFAHAAAHVLLPFAGGWSEVDERLASRLDRDAVAAVIASVPDDLLEPESSGTPSFASAEEHRAAYLAYFMERLQAPRAFATELEAIQRAAGAQGPRRREYRR
jgi:hypothetical protein